VPFTHLPTVLPLTGGGDDVQWLECRCTMCDSHPSLVGFGSVKSKGEAQRLRVVGSVSRARHEDSTKVERCRRDVWSEVRREVGVDADRTVSDSVTPKPANQPCLLGGDCISAMYRACGLREARVFAWSQYKSTCSASSTVETGSGGRQNVFCFAEFD
jgi:hypothetical protein